MFSKEVSKEDSEDKFEEDLEDENDTDHHSRNANVGLTLDGC